jgi:NhaP-type Na+/H+ or K+/H+ antiporter
MDSLGFLALLVCILLAGSISRRIRGTIITLPMVYVFLGIVIGGLGFNIVELEVENRLVGLIAELTLLFVLATDASRINIRDVLRDHDLPLRLLGVGLPLMMIAGTICAVLIFSELSFWEAAILGIILYPTDASLGQSVVNNPKVPVRIRQALNIESGLNDGIALPFLLLAVSMATSEVIYENPFEFFSSVLVQILLGTAAGVVVGYLGAKFIQWGQKSGWMSRIYQKISSLVLILVVYGIAEVIGGNGFIAAFTLGLVSSNVSSPEETEDLYEHAEIQVTMLMMLTFMIFGAVLLPPAIESISPSIVLYAILSLSLVRIIPVAISFIGAKVEPITTLFVGWFGPRGVASILYIFIVLESESLPGLELIYAVVMVTVLFSIFAHGITAAPAAKRYGEHIKGLEHEEKAITERKDVSEMPTRATFSSTKQ